MAIEKPVPGTYRVRLVWSLDGQEVMNVFHVGYTSATAPTADMLASTVLTWAGDTLLPLLSRDLLLRRVEVIDLAIVDGATATLAPDGDLPGGAEDGSLPNNCALCVSFRSTSRGRSSRGRFYVPGIPNSQHVDSRLSGAWVANVVAAFSTLLFALTSVGAELVVVSRYSEGEERPTPVKYVVQSAIAVDNIVDSQRRRLPGRGR